MILVTGSTGNVGSALVAQLAAAGARVRALVRAPLKHRLAAGVEVVAGDLDDQPSLVAAMRGVTAVYLIAFHTEQVAHAVAAARATGVRRMVRQSTIEAGLVPPLGPGRWHREQERLLEGAGLAWTHLRPTMMMSNVVGWWAGSIAADGSVHFPGGPGRVSPVAPEDVARLAASVLRDDRHVGRSYDVTGPELLTIPDMVAALATVLGRPLRYVDVPETAAGEQMKRGGLPEDVVEGLVETLRALRADRFARVSDCIERVTGAAPMTFGAWARAHAAAFGGGR